MKRTLLVLALALSLLVPAAASTANAAEAQKIVVGVTPFPHKDIMQIAKKLLAAQGYDLVIKEFTDYVQPNLALADKQLDANFFQHVPYLDNMNAEKNLGLVWVAKVHIEPMGLYSKQIKSLDEIKNGSTLAVPNDPTNEARALRLLEAHKLITLKAGDLVTVKDITANPRNLKIMEMEAPLLPRTLEDVTAAVINTNFAGEAGLIPSRDAIVIESKDSPYANIVVVRAADKDSPAVQALVKAVQSDEVKQYIVKELEPKGIMPAF